MGVTVHSILAYGVRLPRGISTPWPQFEADTWWLEASGFKPTFYPYTPDKQYKAGIHRDSPELETYLEEKLAWKKAHPMPVHIVSHSLADDPCYIISLEAYVHEAGLGGAKEVSSLPTPPTEEVQKILDFMQEHFPDLNREPRWWLCAYHSY